MQFYDEIYYSLIGEMAEDTALPWVPNAFSPGSECEQAYTRLLAARDRVNQKMGAEEDADLEQMPRKCLPSSASFAKKLWSCGGYNKLQDVQS